MKRIRAIIEEFKAFAVKGNVFDLAIGVIIGNAFNKIVSSMVNDIIMPVISLFLGQVNIQNLSVNIPSRFTGMKAISISYGVFLQNILDFLTVSVSIFLMIKLINKFHKKQEPESSKQEPSHTDELLGEIRDILRSRGGGDIG